MERGWGEVTNTLLTPATTILYSKTAETSNPFGEVA